MAPAIDPAKATWGRVISGKGVTTRFETLYAAKRRELTAAMPTKGLTIPIESTVSRVPIYNHRAADPYPYIRRMPLRCASFVPECPWALSTRHPLSFNGPNCCAVSEHSRTSLLRMKVSLGPVRYLGHTYFVIIRTRSNLSTRLNGIERLPDDHLRRAAHASSNQFVDDTGVY